jgi:hypothetical protein
LRRSKTAERLEGPTNTESCCISRNVGLSMMCYASGKAERICLGERQLSGRIICLINDCAEDHFFSAAIGNTFNLTQIRAQPCKMAAPEVYSHISLCRLAPRRSRRACCIQGVSKKERTWPYKKHGLRYLHGAANREGACRLTIPDVQGFPINYVIIFAYSTQMKTCGADRWMQDNP